MSDIGTAYVNIVPKAEGIKGMLTKQLGASGDAAGASAGNSIAGKIKGVLAAAGIGAVIIGGLKKSLSEGAELEQSIGGIETLFKGSADKVIANAKQSFKTVGMSANEYMQNVTSFSAGLIKSMGGDTNAAVKIADTAMVDMADNANKMGTDMTSIQNAYQGFAKQNYTMLDNLKLGYGGTKSEMERLLADAEKISGQKYDISNLNDVYSAIHVIQGELGITGTTAKEASETLAGSFGSMKAAFQDLMGNLAMGENIGPSVKNLVDTAITFLAGNLLPAVGRIIMSLPSAISAGISALIPYVTSAAGKISTALSSGIMAKIPEIANKATELISNFLDTISAYLPAVLKEGSKILIQFGTGLIEALPSVISNLAKIISKTVDFIAANAPKYVSAGVKLIKALAKSFVQNLPAILVALGKLVLAIGKALLKLGPLGLKYGWALLKELGAGIAKGIGGVIDKVKGFIDKITAPFRKAVDTIKGFFPINIGNLTSHIKLPHFSISGKFSINPPSIPKFGVQWYAKGGIMDGPTLFGGGEKGPEAIVPLDPFWSKLEKMKSGNTFNISMTVDGAQDPEAWADKFARRLELKARAF